MILKQRTLSTDMNGFGRIPFALIAVSILLMSAIISESLLNIARLKGDPENERRFVLVETVSADESQTFESIAVYSLSSILSNLSSLAELQDRSLNKILLDACIQRFDQRYPLIAEGYEVDLNNHYLSVMTDWARAPGGTDPVTSVDHGQYPVYLRIIGSAELEVRLVDGSNLTARKFVEFDRKVMVPLPLFINSIEVFRAAIDGSRSDMARLVQYILTTTVQMRVLAGEGISTGSDSDLLSGSDVETALKLAMILEQARIFRAFDEDTVKALGLNEMLEGYLSSGELDGADLYFILKNMGDRRIDLGRILSGSILVYADEFVYRLLGTFWPEQTLDAPLQEPVYNYTAIKTKGEDFAKEKLREFLEKLRQWLVLPPLIFPHFGTAEIPKITRHATSMDETSKYPVPVPVRGDYDLFTMPYPAKWFAVSGGVHIEADSWPPTLSAMDAVDLILGESSDVDLRPEPYEITFFSTFGLPKTIKYYMVNQSFTSMYANPNSTTPYFNCLRYIMETVSTGISTRKTVFGRSENGSGKGMLDLMADDAGALAGTIFPETKWSELTEASRDPSDGVPVLTGGTKELVEKRFSPALSSFRMLARGQELSSVIPGTGSWYESGLLKPDDENNSFYHLILSAVDLFYELYLTLYESSNAKPGKLDGNWAWNLPGIYYAPIDEEQMKTRANDNFNFNRDAVKHAYNSVWSVVILHLVGSKSYFHPDAVSPGEFRYAIPPIPEVAWLLYGLDKYPRDLSCSNLQLWDDVGKALKPALKNAFTGMLGVNYEADLAMNILDLSTDSREYRTMFYEFLWFNIGKNIMGPPVVSEGSTIESLVAKDGWLELMLFRTMPGEMNDHIGYRDLTVRTKALSDLPFLFEQTYIVAKEKSRYSFAEKFDLHQRPRSISDKDILVEISEPVHEPRFVSVQEGSSELSDAPFVTSWTISIGGTLELDIGSLRKNMLTQTGYLPLELHEQFTYGFSVPISVFSTYPLGGKPYPMTDSVMGIFNNGTRTGSDLSAGMLGLLDAQVRFETVVMDKIRILTEFVSNYPLGVMFEHPSLHMNESELYYNMDLALKPILITYRTDLKAELDNFFNMFKTDPVSIQTRFWGMDRSFESGSFFQINITSPGSTDYFLNIQIDKAGYEDSCMLAITSGYIKIEFRVRNSMEYPEGCIDATATTPEYTIVFSKGFDSVLPVVANIIDEPGTGQERIFEDGNGSFYFHDSPDGKRNFISLTAVNVTDDVDLNNYIDVLRSASAGLLDHFTGANGGSWATLPASLFFGLDERELDPGGLLLTTGKIDRSQNKFIMHTVSLVDLFGPKDIFRNTSPDPLEELLIRTNGSYNEWIKITYSPSTSLVS